MTENILNYTCGMFAWFALILSFLNFCLGLLSKSIASRAWGSWQLALLLFSQVVFFFAFIAACYTSLGISRLLLSGIVLWDLWTGSDLCCKWSLTSQFCYVPLSKKKTLGKGKGQSNPCGVMKFLLNSSSFFNQSWKNPWIRGKVEIYLAFLYCLV